MTVERKKVVTPPFRVSFPKTFEKEGYKDSKPKYSVVMLFYPGKFNDKQKKQFAAMKAILNEVSMDRFKKSVKDLAPNYKRAFRSGEEKADLDGYGEGCVFATASSLQRPGLIDKDKVEILSPEDFYPGCWARATVTAYAYENIGKGVAFGLQNIQKLRDDENFTGRIAADEDFDDAADEAWGDEEVAPEGKAGDDFLD